MATTTEMTIYDPDGNEYTMYWTSDVRIAHDDVQTWCDFCQELVIGAWFNDEGKVLFILCDSCAKALSGENVEVVTTDLF